MVRGVVPTKGGHLADAQAAHRAASAAAEETACASSGSRWLEGRRSDTPAPTSDVAARIHRAVCMLWMNGWSAASDRPDVRPEKIRKSSVLGTAAVMIASTKAIDGTAPVFWSIMRAPAALGRDRAHHRRGVRRVEHPGADAGDEQPQRALPERGL